MLAAQLQHEWMILRIISVVMDRPTERYLAESELGVFAERIIGEVEDALKRIVKIDLDGGAPAAMEAAQLVEKVTIASTEIETFVSLSRDHGWGAALMKHRKALASIVEGRLRECEKYFHQALPTGRARLRRIRRSIPSLEQAPDETAVRRCLTLLAFVGEVRHSANYGGFASARSRLLDTLREQIDHYIEEVLDLVKTGEAQDLEHARAYLRVAGDFVRLIHDEKAADLVRRRAAAAFAPAEPRLAAGT
jgi:hypothetical protein